MRKRKKELSWSKLLEGVTPNCITCGHHPTDHEIVKEAFGIPLTIPEHVCWGSKSKKRCKCKKLR
jgi:hypothetical protein